MSLPDTPTPLGRRVDDASIRKHCLTGRPAPAPHFFRRNLRAIVHQCFKDVLPEVEGKEPMRDDSVEWYFSLRRSQDGGRQDWLAKARPLKRKGWVPREAVDVLAAAVQNFETICGRGSQDSRDLRVSFTLPDPEKAPQMYRLYGPRKKPLLTSLWGFEQNKDETNSVTPAKAVEMLRKQEVPGWVIFTLQGVLKPAVYLALFGLCAWSAPRGWELGKTWMQSEAVRAAAQQYTAIADDAAGNAHACSEVQASMAKIKAEALGLKNEIVAAQSKTGVSLTGFGGPYGLLNDRFTAASKSKTSEEAALAKLKTRAAELRAGEHVRHFESSLKKAEEEFAKAQKSLASADEDAEKVVSALAFIAKAVDDPVAVAKLVEALADARTKISDLDNSSGMQLVRTFYSKLSNPEVGQNNKNFAKVQIRKYLESIKADVDKLPQPWKGQEGEVAKSPTAKQRVDELQELQAKLKKEVEDMQRAVSQTESSSSPDTTQ